MIRPSEAEVNGRTPLAFWRSIETLLCPQSSLGCSGVVVKRPFHGSARGMHHVAFPPRSRATTERKSLLGLRRPLSRCVGKGLGLRQARQSDKCLGGTPCLGRAQAERDRQSDPSTMAWFAPSSRTGTATSPSAPASYALSLPTVGDMPARARNL